MIKSRSSTQHIIISSSAEVGLYALLKCVCQTFGITNLGNGFGLDLPAATHIDTSAALAIIRRQGLGKLRHIDARWLWIQDKAEVGDIHTKKVDGKQNPADLPTEHLAADDVNRHMNSFDFEMVTGRASKSFTINAVEKSNKDHWALDQQCVVRMHNEPRRNLYDPFQSRGAPKTASLTSSRVNHGIFEDGGSYVRQDNWICKSSSDFDLGRPWIGRIVFIPEID